ncbi:MAG: hypothetical protein ACOYZ7_20125 [Chloroflexota bacterium]
MRVATFLIIKAIVSLVFGVALALIPATLMDWYGVTLDESGAVMAQTVGACLIGIGLICWLGREVADDGRRTITLSLFIGDSVGFIVMLLAQLAGLMSGLGWALVVIWLLLALGNGYCRFIKLGAP